MDIENMSAYELDTLKEIGNIGASSAATAMAKVLGKRIYLSLPNIKILEFKNIAQVLGGEEAIVVGILQPMSEDLKGHVMFLMKIDAAHDLADFLLSQMLNVKRDPSIPETEFTEMEISALREIGNIMITSYLSAISDLTHLRIKPLVPEIAIDMAAAVLSVPAIEFGKIGDHVLFIDTEFSDGDTTVEGDFFLIPDVNSYSILLRALGVSS